MTLKKVVIGVLNVVFIYFIIIFSVTVDVFSGFGIPTGIYFVLISADICLILLLLICAIFDLVTMIMLKRNHCGRKVMEIREKTKKYFKILAISCVCFPIVMIICVLLFSH